MNKLIGSFSLTAKIIFYFLLIVFVVSGIALAWRINNHFLIKTPEAGGVETEGVIDMPQFINPLLAVTDSDEDLASLVYSGLMKRDTSGKIIPDLAESYAISPDGKTYTFNLKKNLTFQDGTPVTSDDVVFTVQKAQDQAINSSEEATWQNVSVQANGPYQVIFTLEQPYAPFLENTTLGILPKHLWDSVTDANFGLSRLNTNPIGSGPYELKSISKNSENIPTSYTLSAFSGYSLGKPLISNIVFKFYANETDLVNAYKSGAVDAINSITPEAAEELVQQGYPVATSTLPRVFAIFFNQNNNQALQDETVREALDITVNREYIVNTALQGFAEPISSPVPQSFLGPDATDTPSLNLLGDPETAKKMLDEDGWKIGADGIREKQIGKVTVPLSFSISTTDAAELRQVAETLQSEWRNIGADVDVKIFEGGYLHQNIIRTRDYEALLFGQVINPELDLYPFWASSEAVDPGLNVALYSNKSDDKILSQLRIETDPTERTIEYETFAHDIASSSPAVFLYAPDFMYFGPKQVKADALGKTLEAPSDRFANVYEWYINTYNIWKFFKH